MHVHSDLNLRGLGDCDGIQGETWERGEEEGSSGKSNRPGD